jgi:hypothetical protein
MASRPGDGPSEAAVAPKDRRLPLHRVVFNLPTAVPGAGLMLTDITVGEMRSLGGNVFTCPQPYFDPVTRTIIIAGREYPVERAHYWERASMAITHVKPAIVHDVTIGKRT